MNITQTTLRDETANAPLTDVEFPRSPTFDQPTVLTFGRGSAGFLSIDKPPAKLSDRLINNWRVPND